MDGGGFDDDGDDVEALAEAMEMNRQLRPMAGSRRGQPIQASEYISAGPRENQLPRGAGFRGVRELRSESAPTKVSMEKESRSDRVQPAPQRRAKNGSLPDLNPGRRRAPDQRSSEAWNDSWQAGPDHSPVRTSAARVAAKEASTQPGARAAPPQETSGDDRAAKRAAAAAARRVREAREAAAVKETEAAAAAALA